MFFSLLLFSARPSHMSAISPSDDVLCVCVFFSFKLFSVDSSLFFSFYLFFPFISLVHRMCILCLSYMEYDGLVLNGLLCLLHTW